jgi:hypothetical protein
MAVYATLEARGSELVSLRWLVHRRNDRWYLIDMVSRAASSVRGPAIGLAITLALVAGACSGGSSSGDGGPRDTGRDGSGVADAPDARSDAGDAPADVGGAPVDAGGAPVDAGDAPADVGDAPAADAADAPADAADTPADVGDAPADDAADGRADAAIAADVRGDQADAPSGADLPPDGATDAPADMASGPETPADTPPLSGCASPGIILCETFEGTLPGSLPTAPPWLNRPVFGICDSNSTLAVEGTQAHGGARGLTSHSFSNQCVLEADLGVHPELWVRAWVRSDAPGPGQVDVSEMTLFGIGTNQSGDDPRIAVGYAGTIAISPCGERPGISVNTTGGSSVAGCTGRALPTDQWMCFELHVMQAGSTVRAQLYIDGQQQTFASTPDAGSTTTVTNISGATVRYLTLGVRQYGSRYVTPAYYDDVAAGTERIGCNN